MPHPFRAVPATLWNLIFKDCPVPLAVVNADGEFEEVNHAYCTLLRRPPSHLLGQTFQKVTRAEDVDHDVALADKVRRGELPGYSLVKAYLAPDFTFIWVQLNVQGYREADRFICFYVSAIPVLAPVTASAVQPVRANGLAGWCADNWKWIVPYILAGLAASYTFYANRAVERVKAEDLTERVKQLEHKQP